MLVGADEDRVVATVVARLTERVLARARAPGGQARDVVTHYAEEIRGHFDPRVYGHDVGRPLRAVTP